MPNMIDINGWNLPVLDGSLDKSHVIGGARSRKYGGRLRDHRRFKEFVWTGETPTLTPTEANAVSGLLKGLGDRWDFANSDKLSAKGTDLGTDTGVTVVASSGVGGSKAGLEITSGNKTTIVSPLTDPFWDGTWTAIFFHSTTSGSGHERYVVTSASGTSGWKNGSSGTHGTEHLLSYNDTDGFQLQGSNTSGTGATAYYDYIVLLPYIVSDEMAEIWSVNTNTFSPLPFLNMTFANDSTVRSVLGEAEKSRYLQVNIDGTWYQDAQRVSFMVETTQTGLAADAEAPGGFDSGFDSGFG